MCVAYSERHCVRGKDCVPLKSPLSSNILLNFFLPEPADTGCSRKELACHARCLLAG
jgi:hypothetical protein